MKPAFALDFRNDAISLLHRTSGGWQQVGRVTFDEPDLAAALGYLRSTALGLSPRGLATKLILPDDQILVTTVDAPGPDDASRAAQIRAALEGRTPYPVEDLVFDWEVVGGAVHVAVIWRQTLAEAEAFAVEHRFNPVAFVAAPAAGFVAEPWFGQTAYAAEVLTPGETVEREGTQVASYAAHAAEADRGPEAQASADEGPFAAEAAEPLDPEPIDPEPIDPVEEPVADTSTLDADTAQDDLADQPVEAELTPAPQDPVDQGQEEPTAPPPAAAEDAPPIAEDAWLQETPAEISAAAFEDLPDLPPLGRAEPVFGLADDEPAPSEAFRGRTVDSPAPALPDDVGQEFDTQPALSPAPKAAPDLQPQGLGVDLNDPVQDDEAPMAVDVEDDEPARSDAALAAPPGKGPMVTDPSLLDDVPPMPGYSPAMGFASRRASAADAIPPPKLSAPPRPTVARPVAAKPLPPVAPKAERPMVDRPTAVNPNVPRENKGLRGLGALVTAPGLPGSRKKKTAPPPAAPSADAVGTTAGTATAAATPAPAATKRAAALEKGLGAQRGAIRGKPRHLGLILTVVLLLLLAVIAAWSTSLAFRQSGDSPTELAASDVPAPEEEMLADGILPEDAAIGESATAPAEDDPAPEAVASDAVAPEVTAPADESGLAAAPVAPEAAAGGEIVLAAKDPSPAAPAPVDLPEQVAQGDPLPLAQAPPPPFGTVYQFDEKGLIVPTPEGIVTPEGVLLVAGKPPRVPPARPEGLVPATPTPAPAVETPDQTPDETGALPTVADPALAGFRPKARPEGLTPPVQVNEAPAVTDNRLAGKRPMARPEAVLVAGEAAKAAASAAAASLAAEAAPQPETASTSPMAVAISRRPEPRPRDLSRAVEAAVAAAVRTTEPQPDPEPEPEQTASLVPKKAPEPKPEPEVKEEPKKKTKTVQRGKDGNVEVEADDEPELEAAPKSKTSGSVAKQATFKNALAMDKTALIGVYGTPSKRYAMIRTSGGRYKKVKIGDSIDGGRIQAITASEVRYQKGSRLITLSLPRG